MRERGMRRGEEKEKVKRQMSAFLPDEKTAPHSGSTTGKDRKLEEAPQKA